MNWLHYLLEANIYLSVFYLLYFVFLKSETHYKLNRIYLLATCIIAYIIPIIQIGALKNREDGAQIVTIIDSSQPVPILAAPETSSFSLHEMLIYAYVTGAVIMLIILIFKLVQLL